MRSPAALATRAGEVSRATSQGALAIDTGELVSVSAIAQFAVNHDAAALAGVVHRAGWRVLVPTRRDLAAPRESLERVAHALAEARVPYVLSNLACDASRASLCRDVRDGSVGAAMVTVANMRVAVVSAVSPSALEHVASDRSEGLHLLDPAESIARATRTARAQGAQRVVAVYDPERGAALSDALAVARAIPVADAPDVLLVNGLSREVRQLWPREHSAMQMVATQSGRALSVELGATLSLRPSPVGPALEAASAYQTQLAQTICDETAVPLQGGNLQRPMSSEQLVRLVADVLRHHARADVAIVNYGIVDRRHYRPLRGQLRRLDLLLALPLDNAIVRTRMKGKALRELFTEQNRTRFSFRGLSTRDNETRVNGRAMDDDEEYVVASTDYVTHLDSFADLTWQPVGTRSLRESVLGFLSIARTRDPRLDADDPRRNTRWSMRFLVDGSLNVVQVNNPDPNVLSDAQISRSQALTGQLSFEARANADHPDYQWENTLLGRYGVVRSLETMMGMMPTDPLSETADLLSLRSVFSWRGLRSRIERWYVPSPYVELYAESEFTQPSTRMYRHLELRPTGGARFSISEHLSVFMGFGASWEVLAVREQLPLGQRPLVSTINLGWMHQPSKLFSIGGREAQWDSTVDLALRDAFRLPGVQLRGQLGLTIPLIGPLSLTARYEVFLRYLSYEREDGPQTHITGFANDLTVGLGLNFLRSVQTFVR
ncbi:MAG: 5'-nucleotidase C-terminal domain-containing protein [Deltaproteobacteria bacterium]|nr:5'-nucleotidase C-terminal domain-containing protein [Deltaproteobacteria bacterium]